MLKKPRSSQEILTALPHSTMKIAVGSRRTPKLEAVEKAACKLLDVPFQLVEIDAPSGVSEQPRGPLEITQGAKNRAAYSLEHCEDAEIGVGLEGGLVVYGTQTFDLGLVSIVGRTGIEASGGSPLMPVPEDVVAEINATNQDLSEVLAHLHGSDTIETRDAPSLLTGGQLTVVECYQIATELALRYYLGKM